MSVHAVVPLATSRCVVGLLILEQANMVSTFQSIVLCIDSLPADAFVDQPRSFNNIPTRYPSADAYLYMTPEQQSLSSYGFPPSPNPNPPTPSHEPYTRASSTATASAPALSPSMDSIDWFGMSFRTELDDSQQHSYPTQIRSAPVAMSPSPSPYSPVWMNSLPAMSEGDLPMRFGDHGQMVQHNPPDLSGLHLDFGHQQQPTLATPTSASMVASQSSPESGPERKECAHCHATSTPLWRT